MNDKQAGLTRRAFSAGSIAAALGCSTQGMAWAWGVTPKVEGETVLDLAAGWQFGGSADAGGEWHEVSVPHTVVPLSWQRWEPAEWEKVWRYRRQLNVPAEAAGRRVLLHFERVMSGADVEVNGHKLPRHEGGFLPFEYEITDMLRRDGNEIAVAVDGRWLDVPPSGSPKGPPSVDYMLPAGITGGVSLRLLPQSFVSELFAKPVRVLHADRAVEVSCAVDTGRNANGLRVRAELRHGDRVIAHAEQKVAGREAQLTLSGLKEITLWDVDRPKLYEVVVSLLDGSGVLHRAKTRIGFREARFELDGFYLNGRRLQVFGLNRHELFPYFGFAAPDRAMRKDAEMLRNELNCNFVRCSHYPQSEAFLDACDELGLMVWEELPGWQYVGDASWKEAAVRDVEQMIRRDRNHASVVVWGTRVNESPNQPELYARTRALAKSLDDSRQSSGTMTPESAKDWKTQWSEDVFAFDDYHAEQDGSVGIFDANEGVPYLIAETVGQYNYAARHGFNAQYRRAGDMELQQRQGLMHAQAHSRAAAHTRIAGVVAWCAFDYGSPMNSYEGVKCPGVVDVFRMPKLGAGFYMSQGEAGKGPVIEPNFCWDFGPQTPHGPGERAAIFTNCEWLEVAIGDKAPTTVRPDVQGFPHLKHAPCFVDLRVQAGEKPDLRITGYVAGNAVLVRQFSADRAGDRLGLWVDDAQIFADGVDATRISFAAIDRFGARRPYVAGAVRFEVQGPGEITGDQSFELGEAGGGGAVWLHGSRGEPGKVTVRASHATLGSATVSLTTLKRTGVRG